MALLHQPTAEIDAAAHAHRHQAVVAIAVAAFLLLGTFFQRPFDRARHIQKRFISVRPPSIGFPSFGAASSLPNGESCQSQIEFLGRATLFLKHDASFDSIVR